MLFKNLSIKTLLKAFIVALMGWGWLVLLITALQ